MTPWCKTVRLPLPKCLFSWRRQPSPGNPRNFPAGVAELHPMCQMWWVLINNIPFVGECQSLVGGLLYHCYPIIPCCSNLFRDNNPSFIYVINSLVIWVPRNFLGDFIGGSTWVPIKCRCQYLGPSNHLISSPLVCRNDLDVFNLIRHGHPWNQHEVCWTCI